MSAGIKGSNDPEDKKTVVFVENFIFCTYFATVP
jgi:hypothetical protein